MIVLDTNVLSELMRPAPSDAVIAWVSGQPMGRLFTTSVSQAEILFGIALLPDGRRREALAEAASRVFAEDFVGRVLPFDGAAASAFAEIAASRRRSGQSTPTLDTQIAAIAFSRGAAVASRNIADFQGCGLTLIDPWKG